MSETGFDENGIPIKKAPERKSKLAPLLTVLAIGGLVVGVAYTAKQLGSLNSGLNVSLPDSVRERISSSGNQQEPVLRLPTTDDREIADCIVPGSPTHEIPFDGRLREEGIDGIIGKIGVTYAENAQNEPVTSACKDEVRTVVSLLNPGLYSSNKELTGIVLPSGPIVIKIN